MIRIETTAEFDAEGRFTVTGQVQAPVTPGPHRVTVVITEGAPIRPVKPETIEDTDDPMLKRINGVLVWTGELLEDPEEVRQKLDEQRTQQFLSGQFE